MMNPRTVVVFMSRFELDPNWGKRATQQTDEVPRTTCDVEIRYRTDRPGSPIVVTITELAENPGSSITNASEAICTRLFNLLGRPLNGIVFIEHYAPWSYIPPADATVEPPDIYSVITFDKRSQDGDLLDPTWHPLDSIKRHTITVGGADPELHKNLITFPQSDW